MPRDNDLPIEPYRLHKDTADFVAEIQHAKYMQSGEERWEDLHHRVAEAIFSPADLAVKEFERELHDRVACPAGRILAGVGTGKNVTFYNCFVAPLLQDSMRTDPNKLGKGIMSALADVAYSMQMGGGVGTDFSPLRPEGALVKRLMASASGPLAFMDMWDAMCRTVMSAGARRGAMMATLRCDHPDILKFIEAKHDPARLRMFNVSVLVTDAFMEAVRQDAIWRLGHWEPPINKDDIVRVVETVSGRAYAIGGVKAWNCGQIGRPWYVYRELPAREIWDSIMRSTYDHAEPGVIFIDRVNYWNNLYYCENIQCTNPCFAAETLIVTDRGAFPIEELAGRGESVSIWDGSRWVIVDSFRETNRHQPMLKISLQDGSILRVTPYHEMVLNSGVRCEARNLRIGDALKLSDVTYDGDVEEPGAYIKGFLIGDGHLHRVPVLHLYEPKYGCRGRLIESAAEIVPEATRFNNRTYDTLDLGFSEQAVARLAMTGLTQRRVALKNWCSTYKVRLPERAMRWSRRAKTEFLAGLFDADGTALDTSKAFGYQLSSISRQLLEDVQTMLKSLGVRSKIGLMKKAGWSTDLPGRAEGYAVQDCWRLTVAQASSIVLAKFLRFARLQSFADRTSVYDVKPRMGQIVAIEEDGVDDRVYCCTVPGSHSIALGIGIVTGQCGEQAMAPDDACNLCHINLSRCITGTPCTDTCRIDFERIDRVTRLLVRQADRIIDISPLATERQELAVKNKRRIGLGVTGLANLMMFMRVRYGSPASCKLTEDVMACIRDAAYRESIELAKEKGSFPLFDRDKYLAGKFVESLPEGIRHGIAKYGIRNSLLLSLAPTGTVSLAQCDNCSGGIEPVFAPRYKRKVLQPDNSFKETTIEDFGFRVYANVMANGDLDRILSLDWVLPDYMVTTEDLTPEDHLVVQAAAQKYVDNSISKTVNVPADISFEDFVKVYERAYELGCKSCTTYRPNPESGRGSVLSVEEPITSEKVGDQTYTYTPTTLAKFLDKKAPEAHYDPDRSGLRKRPDTLTGETVRLRWGSLPYPMFLTMNDEVDGQGRRIPYEVFINSKAVDYAHWVSALTRMISAVMRKGGDLSFIPDELKAVWSARGGEMIGRTFVPSEVALIGMTLEKHFRDIGYISSKEPLVTATEEEVRMTGVHYAETGVGRECTACGALQVIRSEGCDKCLSCGYSSCG